MNDGLITTIEEVKEKIIIDASTSTLDEALLVSKLLGPKSEFGSLSKQLATLPKDEKQQIGVLLNECKKEVLRAIQERAGKRATEEEWFDFTAPGQRPPVGHLHIVTQAITDITRIFERIGFTRVRHPEIDTDWYAFESLNMPPDHPARDEWETFFIQSSMTNTQSPTRRKIVLTPHTSNGQVREMEKGKLPIRMINIAKCYRRQSDISHVPMFHQFEGMYIDKNVSIGHLKGFIEYFVKQYFGPERKSRLRPFHFQFTEPSFEVDISCGICNGTSKLPGGGECKLCKGGWLELAGSGMIHPNVLRSGGVDPAKYSGFAIGWGVERTA
ncbi:MAG: phenylalanine--tRNA ligase subunit alpha, partial [Patescibacteria group bacterium]